MSLLCLVRLRCFFLLISNIKKRWRRVNAFSGCFTRREHGCPQKCISHTYLRPWRPQYQHPVPRERQLRASWCLTHKTWKSRLPFYILLVLQWQNRQMERLGYTRRLGFQIVTPTLSIYYRHWGSAPRNEGNGSRRLWTRILGSFRGYQWYATSFFRYDVYILHPPVRAPSRLCDTQTSLSFHGLEVRPLTFCVGLAKFLRRMSVNLCNFHLRFPNRLVISLLLDKRLWDPPSPD